MKNKSVISFLILFLFFIYNCGFTPQYSSVNGLDFSIVLNKVAGERDLNNALKAQIKRYENTNNSDIRIININVESKFITEIVSKNTLGEVTRYNLKANIKFDIIENGVTKNVIFSD